MYNHNIVAKMHRSILASLCPNVFSYLHTVIVFVSHNDSSLTVTGHPGWTIELARSRAKRAKLMVEGTARLEDLENGGVKRL